jgi:hypothetical protein
MRLLGVAVLAGLCAGEARTAAAGRLAASHTADPRVRIALETFAADGQTQNGEVDDEVGPAARRRLVIP